MEEFDDDDDYSDLYADVEVQASSAISAMHGLTGTLPPNDGTFSNDISQLPREEADISKKTPEDEKGFCKIEITVGESGSCRNATGVEEGETENGEDYETGSESEDDLNVVLSDDGVVNKQNVVNYSDDNMKNGAEFGVKNGSKYTREEIEEGEIKVGEGINGKKFFSSEDCYSHKKESVEDWSNSKKKTSSQTISNSEDSSRSLGTDDEGRKKFASGRVSRRTHPSDTMSLDLDKYGTVQIYDSEEDNHHELSGCDSEENSDDIERRNASRRANKGFSCSPSPCTAGTNGDRVKRHEHSKIPSVRSYHKSQKLATCDYDTSKNSKSCSVKPNTKDGRYYERERVPKGKSHNHSKRPSISLDRELLEHVSSDYRSLRDSKSHGIKPNTMNGRYCKTDRGPVRNEPKLPRSHNRVSNCRPHLSHEDAYDGIGIKGIYDIHQSKMGYDKRGEGLNNERTRSPYLNHDQVIGYEAGRRDNYNRIKKQNFLKKKRTKMDYELEDDWYYKERRHMVQNVNPPNFEVSRKLIPKYSSYDGMQSRSREKGLNLPPFYEYDYGFVERDDRIYMLNTERNSDHLDHRYDHDIYQDRRESDRCGYNNTTFDSSECYFEYTGSVPNCHRQERSIRSRNQRQPEKMHLDEEDYKYIQQSDTIYSEGSSYEFERISRKSPYKRNATDYVAEVPNEREVERCKYKLIGECHCCGQFDQRSNLIHPYSRVHMQPRYLGGEKFTMRSSRRTFEAEDTIHYGRRYGFSNWNDDQEPDKCLHNKFSYYQRSEFLDTEEGQIIDEEISEEPIDCEMESKHVKLAQPQSDSKGNEVVGIADQKIQEIITKMERRRERFKEPITFNNDSGNFSKLLPDMHIETDEGKVLRPTRKRRWLQS